jgi:hypothetical protein
MTASRLIVLGRPVDRFGNKDRRLSWLDTRARLARLQRLRQTHGPSAHRGSAEFDCGSARAWLPKEDKPAEGSIFDLPYEQRHATQCAANLMIGDMGGVYVFICSRCPG